MRCGRPPVPIKKETRSFRIDPRLWEMVQAEASFQNKRTTDIIIEALARYVGKEIRSKNDIDNEKLTNFTTRLEGVTEELNNIKGLLK